MASCNSCQNCGQRTIITDDITGNLICSSCSVIQDVEDFQAYFGGLTGPTGTFVRTGTSGTGTNYSYRDSKIYKAQKLIENITYRLEFSDSKSNEVKTMVEAITEGEYGEGNWFGIFVGACSYVVMRKDNKFVPMVEVAAFVDCDIHELGRMINRVVEFLELKLPDFDIVDKFEHLIRSSPLLSDLSEDKLELVMKQGTFLLQCMVKWFLTTGRRPMPLVVAVLAFVAELNDINNLKIEDLATEFHVALSTCRQRHRELLMSLVKVAQALPWGKDITLKNIMRNVPSVMQFMELKSMAKPGDKKSFEDTKLDDDLIGVCLRSDADHEIYSYGTESIDSQYFDPERSSSRLSSDMSESFRLSHECLSMVHSKFLAEMSGVRSRIKSGEEGSNRRKMRRDFDPRACSDWWKGKSEMSKKLIIKQILEKDVGLDAAPPSFEKGCFLYQKRREKIRAAKMRIQEIRGPLNGDQNDEGCDSELVHVAKKGRKTKGDIDCEDLIIETLLLHKVDEAEIEKGYYNTLLELHVF